MHLVSRESQRVIIDALDLEVSFEAGESIHTESSYKYSEKEIAELTDASGMRLEHLWRDREERFADCLVAPSS